MAKKSKIARDQQRREVVARYAQRRAELKRIISAPDTTPEQQERAQRELQRQPHPGAQPRRSRRPSPRPLPPVRPLPHPPA